MQKKIYSLFLFPCFLALCLAFVSLTSCGDDGDDPPPPVATSSDSGDPPLLSAGNDTRITIEGLDTLFEGMKLIVKGTVSVNSAEETIAKIEIKLRAIDNSVTSPIVAFSAIPPGTDVYDLADGQGEGTDFSPCSVNPYYYKIYVDVYLSSNLNAPLKRDSVYWQNGFKKDYDDCRTYTLTTIVNPSGAGTVAASPQGPYTGPTPVSVTATANSGYAFFNWTDGADGVEGATYNFQLDGNKNLKANFVESKSLVKDATASKEYQRGNTITLGSGSVTFTGDAFEAQGSALIFGKFKLTRQTPSGEGDYYNFDDPRNSYSLNTYDINPSGSLRTEQFVAAGSGDIEVFFDPEYYYIVKPTSSGNWYLLLPESNSATFCTIPQCVSLTVWKVQ